MILRFLCPEGTELESSWTNQQARFSTPNVSFAFATANARAWHSALLSGVRQAQPTSEPLVLPLTTHNVRWINEQHLAARWTRMTRLSRNPFWGLVLSCPTGYDREGLPSTNGPFFKIVAFLGRRSDQVGGETYWFVCN